MRVFGREKARWSLRPKGPLHTLSFSDGTAAFWQRERTFSSVGTRGSDITEDWQEDCRLGTSDFQAMQGRLPRNPALTGRCGTLLGTRVALRTRITVSPSNNQGIRQRECTRLP